MPDRDGTPLRSGDEALLQDPRSAPVPVPVKVVGEQRANEYEVAPVDGDEPAPDVVRGDQLTRVDDEVGSAEPGVENDLA